MACKCPFCKKYRPIEMMHCCHCGNDRKDYMVFVRDGKKVHDIYNNTVYGKKVH